MALRTGGSWSDSNGVLLVRSMAAMGTAPGALEDFDKLAEREKRLVFPENTREVEAEAVVVDVQVGGSSTFARHLRRQHISCLQEVHGDETDPASYPTANIPCPRRAVGLASIDFRLDKAAGVAAAVALAAVVGIESLPQAATNIVDYLIGL